MQSLDRKFWTQQYQNGTTNWDIGYPSPPLKEFIDTIANKELKILVPGAGNAYEVEYLWNLGFKNVVLLDISPSPLENFKKRNPGFPPQQMILKNFFDIKETYDLVLEQTFFCAIDRELRKKYAEKMHEVIVPGGKLAGVLFGKEFDKEGPPFGGTKKEYLPYFEPYFEVKEMHLCKNSIPPRAGNELWIEMIRK
jgi:SAM-dependent methyltransferase